MNLDLWIKLFYKKRNIVINLNVAIRRYYYLKAVTVATSEDAWLCLIGLEETKPKISHFFSIEKWKNVKHKVFGKMGYYLTKEMWGNGQTSLSFLFLTISIFVFSYKIIADFSLKNKHWWKRISEDAYFKFFKWLMWLRCGPLIILATLCILI